MNETYDEVKSKETGGSSVEWSKEEKENSSLDMVVVFWLRKQL